MPQKVTPEEVQDILRDKNGDPVRLSHSTLECHNLCPRKCWYNKHEKLRTPSTPRLKLGTDLHAHSEMYLAQEPLPTVSEEVCTTTDANGFITERFEDEPKELDPMARVIFDHALKAGVLPEPGTVDTERWCEVQIFPGILFVGKVDYSKTDALAPGEMPIMGDHKTRGNVWSKWVKDEVQLCDDPQTLRYAYCLLHEDPVHRVQLEHINYQTDGFDVRKVVATWEDGKPGVPWSHVLENWEETVQQGLDMAAHWKGAIVAEDVHASGGRACWAFGQPCEYMRICEAAPKRANKNKETPVNPQALDAVRALRSKSMKKKDPFAAARAAKKKALAEAKAKSTENPLEDEPTGTFALLERNQRRNKQPVMDAKPPADHPVEKVAPKPALGILPPDHPDVDQPALSKEAAVKLAVGFLQENMKADRIAAALTTANYKGSAAPVISEAMDQAARVSSPERKTSTSPPKAAAPTQETKPSTVVEDGGLWASAPEKFRTAVRFVYESLDATKSKTLPMEMAKGRAREGYVKDGGSRMRNTFWLEVLSCLEDLGVVQEGDELILEAAVGLPEPEEQEPLPSEQTAAERAAAKGAALAASLGASTTPEPDPEPDPEPTPEQATEPVETEAAPPKETQTMDNHAPGIHIPGYEFIVYISCRPASGPQPTDFLQWAMPHIAHIEETRFGGDIYCIEKHNQYGRAEDVIIQRLAVALQKHRGKEWPNGLFIRRDSKLGQKFLDIVLSRLPVLYIEHVPRA